jgi:formylglycine-generating enzyme required for sulfatase activity
MGSTPDAVRERRAELNELPAHDVAVGSFWIDRLEVARDAFVAWCASPSRDDSSCAPLEEAFATCALCQNPKDIAMALVTWSDANAYCRAHGKRLPSEEEWEYVATGAGRGWTYPWGDEAPDNSRLCWSRDGGFRLEPCTRGAFPAGAGFGGILDLAGGVYEWTASGESGSYASPRTAASRIIRGGLWSYDDVTTYRSPSRQSYPISTRSVATGFRCAR